MSPSQRTLLLTTLSIAALVNCSGFGSQSPTVGTQSSLSSPSQAVETVEQHAAALMVVQAAIDLRVSGDDRNLLTALAMSAPEPYRSRLTTKNNFIVAIVGEDGSILHEVSNHFRDTTHHIVAVVAPASATRDALPSYPQEKDVLPGPTPSPYPGTGPYHQLWSTYSPGSNAVIVNQLTIPCSAVLNEKGSEPFAYLGGMSQAPYSNRAESGEQWNRPSPSVTGSQAASNVQPYIRLVSFYGGAPGNAPSSIYTETSNSGGSNDTEWNCTGSSITTTQEFTLVPAYYNGQWGVIFTNYSSQNNGSTFN